MLGQEIAKKLGTEGHLTKLQRIAVGDFVVQDSIPLKEFEAKWISTKHILLMQPVVTCVHHCRKGHNQHVLSPLRKDRGLFFTDISKEKAYEHN